MRHGISGNRLGRNSSLRQATVRDIAKATLVQQRICTTKAKAKEARKLVDKLITLGKKGTLADKRRAFAILCDHKVVSDLFNKTSSRFHNRLGGYTRIILLGTRRGDNAQLAFIELTEKTEIIVTKPKSTATKKKQDLEAKPAKAESEMGKESAQSKKVKKQILQEAQKTKEEISVPQAEDVVKKTTEKQETEISQEKIKEEKIVEQHKQQQPKEEKETLGKKIAKGFKGLFKKRQKDQPDK